MPPTASYTITINEHDCELDTPNDEMLASLGTSFDAYFEDHLKGRSKYYVSLLDNDRAQRQILFSPPFHRDKTAEQLNSLSHGLAAAFIALSAQYQRNS